MVGQSGRKFSRRQGYSSVANPGLKKDTDLKEAAERSLALRRFWLFLLTVALLAVGIVSACGIRLF